MLCRLSLTDTRMQNSDQDSSSLRQSLIILALIVAGETAFFLPFVLPRVFRPTLLDVLDLTNLELGIAFSVYGVVAMLAYFPGGLLADRFPMCLPMCSPMCSQIPTDMYPNSF